MSKRLEGKRIACLATNGVEQIELTKPREALIAEGASVDLVSLKSGQIQGFNHLDKADSFEVDHTIDQVDADKYDALLLPGGVANPDALRSSTDAVNFTRDFFKQGKPVAAICHGPWLLVEADIVKGKKLTSWPSLKTDISNAGGRWVDEEVTADSGLVTSRKPDDLKAFCAKTIEEFAEGIHRGQAA
ncbi:type 1 glutamine amidotransferase domain-containing protein [uncultured Zhongshania sp.]|uniref:type 1 glutamine amidotransferase domain-containing protein n=1 Tax=uncultured Zhongshania sp. TaxID=1642288 RepID=UPI0025E8B7F9|nr:type 1 glutamine amidotransferase domain-containing protein [uncultured Zhongshania sp.]